MRTRFGLVASFLALALAFVAPSVQAVADDTQLMNTASATYSTRGISSLARSSPVLAQPNSAVNINSGVTACGGGPLADFTGWNVGLYRADAAGNPTSLLPLTRTQLPVLANVALPGGVAPNNNNLNPFVLSNGNAGLWEFLLDANAGQTASGTTFVLTVVPPNGSPLPRRFIKIVLGATLNSTVAYTATALDHAALNATAASPTQTGTLPIAQTSNNGSFAVFQLLVNECPVGALGISKTANVVTAQVGDTVLYTITVNNLTQVPALNTVVTDVLPLGFSLVANSTRAAIAGTVVPLTSSVANGRISFATTAPIPAAGTLTIAYATVITPAALHGSAENIAVVDATVAQAPAHGGPASYALRLDAGLLSDCGTIIGRVYVDEQLDGIQREGQPGVADAVVLFDDGVRVKTDAKGLYHYPGCAHPGWRSAVLDLTSVPGFTLAPNLYIADHNGQSQSAHLEPSGLVKINFAVVHASSGVK